MAQIAQWAGWLNSQISRFVWGPVMLACFLAVGLMFSIRTGFFQAVHLRLWLGKTAGACFRDQSVRTSEDRHSISQFQSLCTVLAAAAGTGNIVGVAAAITAGGPGAIFWMWFSSFLGMMTSYGENVLGILYRRKNPQGEWEGGPMAYMERGLGCRWMAVLFSLFWVLASFGIGNMVQANSIAAALSSSFRLSPGTAALLLSLLLCAVMMGGLKRIASVTEKLVPFMSCLYIAGTLMVIYTHIRALPDALASIFREAFRLRAGVCGVGGYGIMTAMRVGITRGVFTNEAGMGSSVIVHSAADTKEPVVQGMWGIFEVFADTLVVCTMTALAILTSGVWNSQLPLKTSGLLSGGQTLSPFALTGQAFATVFGKNGDLFVSISIILFAFATLTGWSYYGQQAAAYLLGRRLIRPYQILFCAAAAVGCLSSLQLVWDISDTFNGLMAIPNLAAITLLSGQVVQATRSYLNIHQSGKKPGCRRIPVRTLPGSPPAHGKRRSAGSPLPSAGSGPGIPSAGYSSENPSAQLPPPAAPPS